MFRYTRSTINETFDLVKRLIYFCQIAIQFVYIAYILYRLIDGFGNLIGNIALLLISSAYVFYQILTTKEFYTKQQIAQRKTIKRVFKLTKYLANLYIVALSVIALLNGNAENENATMLITILMILGVLFSMLFDIILILIDKQITLIGSALAYDLEKFRKDHEFITRLIKKYGLDLEKTFPPSENKKTIKKVEKVNERQEQKKLRKKDFHEKAKSKQKKGISEKEASEKAISEKEVTEKEASKKELSKNELLKKELSEKELLEREVSEKELSKKEKRAKKKKKAYQSLENMNK